MLYDGCIYRHISIIIYVFFKEGKIVLKFSVSENTNRFLVKIDNSRIKRFMFSET